jgi:hypothetical protein
MKYYSGKKPTFHFSKNCALFWKKNEYVMAHALQANLLGDECLDLEVRGFYRRP